MFPVAYRRLDYSSVHTQLMHAFVILISAWGFMATIDAKLKLGNWILGSLLVRRDVLLSAG